LLCTPPFLLRHIKRRRFKRRCLVSRSIFADQKESWLNFNKGDLGCGWEGVSEEGLEGGAKEVMCGLCTEKQATTCDNFVGAFGVEFVDGYSLEGKRVVDLMMGTEE
jgi:hypothetical protein